MSWNPRRAPWKERKELLEGISRSLQPATSWGMVSKEIEPGDRIYLVRLGEPSKEFFAFRTAVSASYMDSHWDEAKRLKGKLARFVDVAFVEMPDPILELRQLGNPPLNKMHWIKQGSGERIHEQIVTVLNAKWQPHLQYPHYQITYCCR